MRTWKHKFRPYVYGLLCSIEDYISPSAYDRVLSTQFGSFAGKLASEGKFGVTVAMVKGKVTYNALAEIAGKAKLVPDDCQEVKTAESIGISMGR